MFKLFVATLFVFFGTAALADGETSLNFDFFNHQFTMDAHHVGQKLIGSLEQPGNLPAINLTRESRGDWSGVMSQEISSTQIQRDKDGGHTITIRALPGGFYTYSVKTEKNGDTQIFGSDSRGRLSSATLGRNGQSLLYQNKSTTYNLDLKNPGRYEGTILTDTRDSGRGELAASGDLEPEIVIKKDPALFILLYVFPFDH